MGRTNPYPMYTSKAMAELAMISLLTDVNGRHSSHAAGQFGHPVSDKTGFTGKYDFTLRYHGSRLSDRSADDMDSVPPLDTAIHERLASLRS
jgi:uncharacterized protein (TIGR03435 family)